MVQSLQINLLRVEDFGDGEVFVHLTQREENGMDRTASVADISQMTTRAKSGQSAHLYRKNSCPATIDSNGNIDVSLNFYAWPSSLDLDYKLTSNIGDISDPIIVDEFVEFSIVFDMVRTVDLDFMLTDVTSVYWETPCYNNKGEELYNQNIELDGLTRLRTDNILFGVARVYGRRVVAKYKLTTKLIKSQPDRPAEAVPEDDITYAGLDGYWQHTDVSTWNGEPVDTGETSDRTGLSIDNLDITIKVKWFEGDEEMSETLRLEIPQCTKDLLSMCDGDPEKVTDGEGTKICDLADRPEQFTVYISSCTGKVLEVRKTREDPDSWCSE